MAVFTVGDLLADRAAVRGTAPAVEHADRCVNYRQLDGLADRFAVLLAERGVRRGDRVAILLPRSTEALACFFGVMRLGAVAVFVNEQLKRRQVGHILRHSGACTVVTNNRLSGVLDTANQERALVLGATVPEPGTGTAIASARPIGRDLAALIYTSGSTGHPKGVMVTHDNLLAGARIVAGYLGLTEADRVLSVLPWSFDAGLNQPLATLWAGGTLVVSSSTFAPDICRTLRSTRITGLAGVPPMWEGLVNRPSPFLRMELPDLRYVTNTGGVLRPESLRRIREAHPRTDFFLMYGLTEAFRSTYLPPELVDERLGSMGMAIPDTEIMLLHESGRLCLPGEVGELVHRGPTVALGYWDDPAATARVFRPHPFPVPGAVTEHVVYSGDYVRADEDGFLTYVGRRDEQFKSRGFRVNPTEIEAELLASGLLAEALVFPEFTDGHADVIAAVVPADESFDLAVLEAHCREALPGYQQPARIDVVASLPRTSSGKLDRAAGATRVG